MHAFGPRIDADARGLFLTDAWFPAAIPLPKVWVPVLRTGRPTLAGAGLGLVSPEQMAAGQRVADFDSVNEGGLRVIYGAVFAR